MELPALQLLPVKMNCKLISTKLILPPSLVRILFFNFGKFFSRFFYCHTFAAAFDSVAQLVEQQTLNLWVQSSSLCGVTSKSFQFLKAFIFSSHFINIHQVVTRYIFRTNTVVCRFPRN